MDAERTPGSWKRKILVAVVILVVVGVAGGVFTWYKFFREEPQPDWITRIPTCGSSTAPSARSENRASRTGSSTCSPRMFPDKLPKPGGLAALGVSWEQGQELPIGFTQKVVGFPRVANNCASCHAASYRTSLTENPVFVGAGPGHTCTSRASSASSSTARRIRASMPTTSCARSSWSRTCRGSTVRSTVSSSSPSPRSACSSAETQFAWVYRKDLPDWGRGRDDAMNLTKYFLPQAAHGQQHRPHRHAPHLESEEVRPRGDDHELGGGQPRFLLGHHRLRPRGHRRRPQEQDGIPRRGEVAAAVSPREGSAQVPLSHQ